MRVDEVGRREGDKKYIQAPIPMHSNPKCIVIRRRQLLGFSTSPCSWAGMRGAAAVG